MTGIRFSTNGFPIVLGTTSITLGSTTTTLDGLTLTNTTLTAPNIGAATGTSLTLTGQFLGKTGTAGSPTYASSADPNTGFFFNADHTIRFSSNGSQVIQLGTSGQFTAVTSHGFGILNSGTSATVPIFLPDQASSSGLGGVLGSADLIAAGVNVVHTTSSGAAIGSGLFFKVGNAATTGLTAGILAASTNASIVISDSSGQAYRIPCII